MLVKTDPAPNPAPVSLLILGAGWTSTFLIPLLQRSGITHAATTTDGRNGTIPFRFDPSSPSTTPFTQLPAAQTILITFPLTGPGPSARLVGAYAATHPGAAPHYIQLGVTSIWTAPTWHDDASPYDAANARAVAEDELLRRAGAPASVLSLAGLYGADRQPRDWVRRVVTSKDGLRAKGALHVIHGADVARAILALHRKPTPGKRWILCDLHVYDWWDLVQDWALQARAAGAAGDGEEEGEEKGEMARQSELLEWVGELMVEEGVRALPRDAEAVGRRLDGRGFWRYMGIWPTQGRIR